jgi:hypothetical protein
MAGRTREIRGSFCTSTGCHCAFFAHIRSAGSFLASPHTGYRVHMQRQAESAHRDIRPRFAKSLNAHGTKTRTIPDSGGFRVIPRVSQTRSPRLFGFVRVSIGPMGF